MRTVYVVAWQYNTGAGFDWYRSAADADAAFEKEKVNADELADESWCAYRFDFKAATHLSDERITDLIDGDLDWLCDNKAIAVYPHKFQPQPSE